MSKNNSTTKYAKENNTELNLEYGDQIKVKTEVGDLIINGNGIMVLIPDFSDCSEDFKNSYKSVRVEAIDDLVKKTNDY
jgi:formylmethanofuran dehydrogenase subunit D